MNERKPLEKFLYFDTCKSVDTHKECTSSYHFKAFSGQRSKIKIDCLLDGAFAVLWFLRLYDLSQTTNASAKMLTHAITKWSDSLWFPLIISFAKPCGFYPCHLAEIFKTNATQRNATQPGCSFSTYLQACSRAFRSER